MSLLSGLVPTTCSISAAALGRFQTAHWTQWWFTSYFSSHGWEFRHLEGNVGDCQWNQIPKDRHQKFCIYNETNERLHEKRTRN
ncbi:hypothetical protein F4777DRAFT_81993 [Nemania sp. FL0916]|nr:hypothetical protein F4777DRAFT_81993 [Nemania sp. FL0916]